MLRPATGLLLLLCAASAGAQERRLYVRDPGPGEPGRILEDVLARPYVVRHEAWNTRLFRDTVFDRSVIVLSSDATVASIVHGDVVVVNGDVFLRPGARVDGRVVAIGGGVYDSEQATVRGAKLAFRDVHFDVDTTPQGVALTYRPAPPEPAPPIVSWPIALGFKIPQYDRVNGASIAWGPRFTLLRGMLTVDPAATYRSDLGVVDPTATARVQGTSLWYVQAEGGRTTFATDRWIQTDLANSATALFTGHDYRDYWRADYADARVGRLWEGGESTFELQAGARTERDWSVRAGGPWSFTGSNSSNGMRRPNPDILRGHLTTALASARAATTLDQVSLDGMLAAEVPFAAPDDAHWVQLTLDAAVSFPTFADQSFILRAHGLATMGDEAPPQRFQHLGGSGTLPTFLIFRAGGGDDLAFVESRYLVPITPVQVPIFGAPIVMLRHLIGSAGIGRLPRFEQNLGVRLEVGFLRADWFVNPANGDHALSFGLSVVR